MLPYGVLVVHFGSCQLQGKLPWPLSVSSSTKVVFYFGKCVEVVLKIIEQKRFYPIYKII